MRIHLRIIATLLFLPATLLAAGVAQAQDRAGAARISLVDRIVAVVISEIITDFELRDRLQRVRRDLRPAIRPCRTESIWIARYWIA